MKTIILVILSCWILAGCGKTDTAADSDKTRVTEVASGPVAPETTGKADAASSVSEESSDSAGAPEMMSATGCLWKKGDASSVAIVRLGLVDGDTIHVDDAAGVQWRVRYVGIDTPETRRKRQDGIWEDHLEPFGPEASSRNAQLLKGGEIVVRLVGKVDDPKRGRELACVQAGGIDVSEKLLSEGLAWLYDKDRQLDSGTRDRYLKAQLSAIDNHRGFWALVETQPGSVVANMESHVFHLDFCKSAKSLKNSKAYTSVIAAFRDGFRPDRGGGSYPGCWNWPKQK